MTVPEAWRERAPCMSQASWRGLERTLQHVDAPRWNRTLGDRVGEVELADLEVFRRELGGRPREAGREPSRAMLGFVDALRDRLWVLADLPSGFDTARDFVEIPTTSREDIVRRLEDLVPRDADLGRAIVYTTSGTTGHPVMVPTHPGAMVKNLAHLDLLAEIHGVPLAPAEGATFALNLGLQRHTYVFATTMSGWRGAVFAKLNLAPHDWAGGMAACRRFVGDFAPELIAVEPVTMAEMSRLELALAPKLVVSSAVTLTRAQARATEQRFATRVVDLYSSTETGPIAATIPGVDGHVVLLPDVFVEVLDEAGERVPDGEWGEITVTGGRNPFLPLVRYRMGDHGRLTTVTLADGRSARAILDLEGRAPVSYRAGDGSSLSSVDIARVIRPLGAFLQHRFVQRKDGSVALSLRPIPDIPVARDAMEEGLRQLFGPGVAIEVRVDPNLGARGKLVAWERE
jgi:phenylacetate-CoA ligase